MSATTRVHGDFKQQAVFETSTYTVGAIDTATSAATVQPQGPKLEFYTITGNGTTSNLYTYANVVISTIQQLSTVYLYEFTTATDSTLAIAAYPVGAWGSDITATADGSLDAALTAAITAAGGTGNVSIAASAAFTN